MPLLTADPVTVLPGQREALEQLVRTHSTPQQVALRARIILHAVEGVGVRESARELGVWHAEAHALTGACYPATAEAVSGARVVHVPADHVIRCIRENSGYWIGNDCRRIPALT